MTMDIANQIRSDLKLASSNLEELSVQKIRDAMRNTSNPSSGSKKRSFDVAFLMQPDEKLREKQIRLETPEISYRNTISLRTNLLESTDSTRNSESPLNEEIDIMTNGNSNSSFGSSTNLTPVTSEVSVNEVRQFRYQPVVNSGNFRNYEGLSDLDVHRSAFTKVPHGRMDSPAPALSPDQLSCPSSSPPAISVTPPRQFPTFRPSEYSFMGNGNQFVHLSPNGGSSENINGGKLLKHQFMYRPNGHEVPQLRLTDMAGNGYLTGHSFPLMGNTPPTSPQFPSELTGIVRNPAAAAILSTLIPPTLASTLTLTAQNVCAKCNISFRMTSDLVYHMRSHHKTDMTGDPHRRKREEKLKCPVCNESFRERHHLTRHMTAHQDKESDEAEIPANRANGSSTNPGTTLIPQLSASRRHSHPISHHHQVSPHNKTH